MILLAKSNKDDFDTRQTEFLNVFK